MDLLSTLARLHDSLLPSLQKGFRIIFMKGDDGLQETSVDMLSQVTLSLKMLSMRIVRFGWKLLDVCYLNHEVFEENFPLPALTKMFPAKVEDPVIRADILVQTFRELSGGYSHVQEGQSRGTFLQNVEKNHKIMQRVEFLHSTGMYPYLRSNSEVVGIIHAEMLDQRVLKIEKDQISRQCDPLAAWFVRNGYGVECDRVCVKIGLSSYFLGVLLF